MYEWRGAIRPHVRPGPSILRAGALTPQATVCSRQLARRPDSAAPAPPAMRTPVRAGPAALPRGAFSASIERCAGTPRTQAYRARTATQWRAAPLNHVGPCRRAPSGPFPTRHDRTCFWSRRGSTKARQRAAIELEDVVRIAAAPGIGRSGSSLRMRVRAGRAARAGDHPAAREDRAKKKKPGRVDVARVHETRREQVPPVRSRLASFCSNAASGSVGCSRAQRSLGRRRRGR
jgi:hypothetical protein